jgi:C-terminal processing protease CtpA/Prc
MRSVTLVVGLVVIALSGCASAPPRVLIDANGNTRSCALMGYGLVGASMAQAGNTNCVTDAKSLGFLPMEETGAVGIVLDDQDKVAARVNVVVRSSPADVAGIKVGDVIVEANGQPVPTKQAAQYQLFGRVNEPLDLRVRRADKELNFRFVRVARTAIYGR